MKTAKTQKKSTAKNYDNTLEGSFNEIPHRDLTTEELEKLSDMVMTFVQEMTGIEMYPYQIELGWRVVFSLLQEDSDEITALFARQTGKCLAPGTEVLMYDGSRKRVEDVLVGDFLMGDDSTPREVLELSEGEQPMYAVVPNCPDTHDEYVVNRAHILSVEKRRGGERVDVPIRRLLGYKNLEASYMGYKVAVEYPEREVPVDPYWFGCWLGDGSSYDVHITTPDSDPEIVQYWNTLADRMALSVSKYQTGDRCPSYALTSGTYCGGPHRNPIRNFLRDFDLLGKDRKRIPQLYAVNSYEVRRQLLAGIIDTDGHIGQENCCEITLKKTQLVDDVRRLAQSLGFRVSKKPKFVDNVEYTRIWMYGPMWEIPTKLPRKQSKKRILRENPLRYGFTIKPRGIGKYYGFVLDGNKRFLLGDYTVTHNTETLANIVVGCMVLFPVFARNIYWDQRIAKFRNGLWVGIYAPNYEQTGILWSRMKSRMYSNSSKSALLDPDIDINLNTERENMILPNGSFVDAGTASPQSKIEGKTYHLLLLEETQDIPTDKILESIHPMAAATAGTLVKIGTCNRKRSEFHSACRRNKRSDLANGLLRSKKRCHFEFDYTIGQKYNPRYRKYVQKEKIRLGEDSDEFRMKYRLHWLLERGMFVNPDVLDDCGIKTNDNHLLITQGKGRKRRMIKFTRPPNVVNYDSATEGVIASIDVGRTNSTVVTIGKVFWDGGVDYADSVRYPMHILNWLELHGDDHEAQHPQILSFLKNYRLTQAIIDATGKGDPVYSRMAAELEAFGVTVIPFIFNATSKDLGYKILSQELNTRRLTFPAGSRAVRLAKWQRFVGQMEDLEKEWRGQQMVVSKPKNSSEARDDFPDSLMMLNWLANVRGTHEVEVAQNPFLGRRARWAAAEAMRSAKSWYRGVLEPSNRVRPGKRGKWD
jgi:hypothetical protein